MLPQPFPGLTIYMLTMPYFIFLAITFTRSEAHFLMLPKNHLIVNLHSTIKLNAVASPLKPASSPLFCILINSTTQPESHEAIYMLSSISHPPLLLSTSKLCQFRLLKSYGKSLLSHYGHSLPSHIRSSLDYSDSFLDAPATYSYYFLQFYGGQTVVKRKHNKT